MNETAIQHHIQLALSQAGHTVFRGNVGLFYTKDGNPIKSGLPVGFSDLFGFTKDLRPFFLEVKSETGHARPEQTRFIAAMQARGAIAAIVRSPEQAIAALSPV